MGESNTFNFDEYMKAMEDGRQLRGSVLDVALMVESMLDVIIAAFFVHYEKRKQFIDLFLADEGCSFMTKKKFLKRIGMFSKEKAGYENLSSDLDKLIEIRNEIAHCHPTMIGKKIGIQKREEKKDLKDLKEKFEQIYLRVNPSLFAIYNDILDQQGE